MKKNRLSVVVRIIVLLCGLALIAVLFTPIWRIELDAPQYPEGLQLTIFATHLGGNVDIINGLNHYIGMRTLHKEDFIEFSILSYVIILFSVIFILTATFSSKNFLNIVSGLFVGFGVIAMIDFWRWEYNYGHNLNPDAAIRIPCMAYQPPLIGFKQLLNFGAYSIPDIGGWIFIAVGVLLMGCLFIEFKRSKKMRLYA